MFHMMKLALVMSCNSPARAKERRALLDDTGGGYKSCSGRKLLLRKLKREPSQALVTAPDSCPLSRTEHYYPMEALRRNKNCIGFDFFSKNKLLFMIIKVNG